MNIKNILNNIKNINPKVYIKTNVLFLTFILGALLNSTLVRFFTVENFFDIKPLIADIAVLLVLGSLAYFLKPKNQIRYFFVWSIVLTTICVLNSIYYTFYSSFASISLLSTSVFVVDVGDAVVKNVLQIKDFIYLWFPLSLIIVHTFLTKKKYYDKISHIEKGKIQAFNTLVFSFVLIALFVMSLTSVEVGRFNKQWNREFLVMKFGLYTYHVNDLIKSIEPKINTAFGYDKAYKKYKDFFDTKDNTIKQNKYSNIFEGKNMIVIHAESIQSIDMNLRFNNQEVTPNLNKIAREGMNFTNFYPQVSVGTSSDTEFTLNTSLLPVSNGTVFVSYWNRDYVTIPKLLKEKNYYSFSMHGNNGTFWNRLVMHKKMGYDKMYHKTSYKLDDIIGLGLSDKSFFRQSIPMIQDIKTRENKPFYGTMIMLSNHTPFDEVEKYGDFPVDYKINNGTGELSAPYMEGTKLGNYFKSVHYADAAIGEFISGLDAAGLLENTVVVIYGDHDARLPKSDYIRLNNYDPNTNSVLEETNPNYKPVDYYHYELNRKVPFIIWTKDKQIKKQVSTVMGMYDVMPTLGNMFNFHNPYQLGTDMFNITNNDNVVVFPNGNWVTNKVYYNAQKEEYLSLKNEPINEDYIKQNNDYANKMLDASNSIIMFDIIKKEKEKALLINEQLK
jgi:lipoteichoic acid synthase